MRSGVAFIFLACLSLLIAMVSSFQGCTEIVNSTEYDAYENALKNSINTFLDELRRGVPGSDMRLEHDVVFDGSHLIEVDLWERDIIDVLLENMSMRGLFDFTVRSVMLIPIGPKGKIDASINLKIPSISIMANYHLNGTWYDKTYDTTGRLNASFQNALASIRLVMELTDDRMHWNLKNLSIRHQYLYNNDENYDFGEKNLDIINDYGRKSIRTAVTAAVETLFLRQLELTVRSFVEKLFRQTPWFFIIAGVLI